MHVVQRRHCFKILRNSEASECIDNFEEIIKAIYKNDTETKFVHRPKIEVKNGDSYRKVQ